MCSIPQTGNNTPVAVSFHNLLGVRKVATTLPEEPTSSLNPLRRSELALTRLPKVSSIVGVQSVWPVQKYDPLVGEIRP